MSEMLERFGQNVRLVRRQAGMTQAELGEKVGMSNVAISQIENANTAPALARVAEIADALGVSIALLFGDRLALAERAVEPVRATLWTLGYDLALVPRGDA